MILWDFYATFVRKHELQAFVHAWKIMLFGSAQWSCEHERHKCRFITSIRKNLPYWKIWLAYFPLRIYTLSIFMWIISLSNFSNLKSTAWAETFSRQKNAMKKLTSINFVFFNAYFLKMTIFMYARASTRATDKRVEKLDNCRCVLHFELSKYLKNR